MSVHVLLNLLKELNKSYKQAVRLAEHLLLFRNKF